VIFHFDKLINFIDKLIKNTDKFNCKIVEIKFIYFLEWTHFILSSKTQQESQKKNYFLFFLSDNNEKIYIFAP
jgi:hypothetical protein